MYNYLFHFHSLLGLILHIPVAAVEYWHCVTVCVSLCSRDNGFKLKC